MKKMLCTVLAAAMLSLLAACPEVSQSPKSTSGVEKQTVKVTAGADGMTTEQRAIVERYKEDNKPGSVKHLYVISAFSGDVLLYSTVKGKVTSSGKRLSPYSVAVQDGQYVGGAHGGFLMNIGGEMKATGEVLQDDGTYGSSEPYIYWWDSKGVYHQHYIAGGQIVHVSSAPLRVGKVIINVETSN